MASKPVIQKFDCSDYIKAANTFYGEGTGELLYGFTDRVCRESFNYELTPDIPIILTTAMSAYNRFSGHYNSESHTIELVRQLCKHGEQGIVPRDDKALLKCLAHELCHAYQFKVLGGNIGQRGPHRCKSWHQAIIKASVEVTGVGIDFICKPTLSKRIGGKVVKVPNPNSLTESEITH